MSNLRDIVLSYVETRVLEEYYKKKIDQISPIEKAKTLEFLKEKGLIDKELKYRSVLT